MFTTALRVLALPLVEYVVLRLWLRNVVNLRPGWGPTLVDTDLFVTIPLAVFVWAWAREQTAQFTPKFSVGRALFHLAALIAFIGVSVYISLDQSFDSYRWHWWCCCLLSFASASFVWVSPREVLSPGLRIPTALTLLLSVVTVVVKHVPTSWSQSLDEKSNQVACSLANGVFGYKPLCYQDCSSQLFVIQGFDFALRIGAGCRGYDGAITFLCLALIYLCARRPPAKQTGLDTWILAGGFVVSLLINPIRVALLYVLGERSSQAFGYEFARAWVGGVFHLHLGLLLTVVVFAAAISLIWWVHDGASISFPRLPPRKEEPA